MKKKVAATLNIVLMALGSFFVFTNTLIFNRPETPEELLRK
jgi:hypothetical protein